MPELPEVETIKSELAPYVVGRCIEGIELFWEKMVRKPSPGEFRSQLIGQRITGLDRRGKYLIFSLSGGKVLIIHLKMTGSLLLKPLFAEPNKYVRAVIRLDDGMAVHFRDTRKFGELWLEASRDAIDSKLGVEPLSVKFTPQYLADFLGKRSAPVKALLLEQSVIAGIGNMYADEALFAAGIHPARSGKSLSEGEIRRLQRAIREVLRAAIRNKGASVDTYLRPDGTPGTAHSEFKVAHRGGDDCPVCGAPIIRIPVRNRGSYFCARCQPLK
jgi:formamidopyrimidine-DNA glycosylase